MQTIVKQTLSRLFVLLVMLAVPVISFCQPPGPGDENPDVPFDDNMNLVFLATGIIFAAVIIVRKLNRKAVA